MTKLELLSAFLTERLAAAAEEILGAVKEAVREYQDQLQGEVLRSREENQRLRRLLNAAVQRLLAQSDPPSLPAEGAPRRWEDECGTRLELLPQVKQEFPDAVPPPEESSSSSIRVQPDLPPPRESPRESPRGSPPPPEVKAEESPGGPAPPEQQLAISFCSSVVISDSKPGAPTPGAPKPGTPKPGTPRPPRPPPPGLQRWHSCRECGKGFSFACQLEVHMRWHTKEKPYGCAVCRKNFTTVSMLKRHHRIHTGEKPFGCHVCGKRFNQSAHLNTHFRLHTRERAGWARK